YLAADNRPRLATRHGDEVVDTGFDSFEQLLAAGPTWQGEAATREPVGRTGKLLAPLQPTKILCCGFNYASHQDEDPDAQAPDEPFFFSKLPSAIIGPNEPISIPRRDALVDWEVELAFVVGRRAYQV